MEYIKKIKILTIILTSFLLWVSFTLYIADIDVKNIIKSENKADKNIQVSDLFLEKDLDLNLFWRVYNIIKSNYYSIDWIQNNNIIYWINKWLVDSLWDKYSEFMTPEVTKKFEEVLSWDFEWIWAVIEKHELWVEIDRVLKWSPAKKFGLLKWDVIVKAWDIELSWMDLYDAVANIKWPAWTKVVLTVFRLWEKDFLIKEIIRDKIKIPSVDFEIFENNVWYIALNMFWENTSEEFEKALFELKIKEVDWIIIDLRDNWGWYLQSAVQVLSNFVDNWKVLVKTKYRNSIMNNNYYSQNFWEIFDKKIVILINSNSASASEITAWALKDYNKAIIIWEKSYWKWSVQQPFDLWDWSLLKLTIAKWFTPNWNNIDLEGIEPDIEVKFKKEDYTPETWKEEEFEFYDRQLEEAKKVMNKFLELDSLQVTIDEYNKENNLVWTWSLEE